MFVLKKCSFCKEEKPTSEFYRNRARYDGFCNFCKTCEKNKPVNSDKAKARHAKWRNSQAGKEYYQQYYQENKDKYLENHRNWVAQNHEKYKNRNKDIKMDRQTNVVSIT